MAVESLQQNGLGTVKDTTVSGSGIVAGFETLGLNLAGALGAIGISKLAQSSGVGIGTVSAGRTSLLSPTAQIQAQQLSQPRVNWGAFAAVGLTVLGLGALVVYAAKR